jgi:hypothetical protein
MKYEIGDKIIVLQTNEEGKVIEIVNEKMVMIEVRGVKFPAYMDQIDFPYFRMFTQKKQVEKKKIFIDNVKKEKPLPVKKMASGVSLYVMPVYDKDIFDDDVVEKLKLYLVNGNHEDYSFDYNLMLLGDSQFQLKGEVPAQHEFYLHDIPFEDVSDSPVCNFIFSLTKPQKQKADYFETEHKLRGKQTFKKIEELKEKNDPGFTVELLSTYPDKVETEKVDLTKLSNAGFRLYDASKTMDFFPASQVVVDLHIDKLTDNHSFMNKSEILDFQMASFEKKLDLAIMQKSASILFIHGIGEGRLRNEIHELLKVRNEVKSFVNQYHPFYGYGATEVFLK